MPDHARTKHSRRRHVNPGTSRNARSCRLVYGSARREVTSFSRRGSPTTLWLLRLRQRIRVAVRDLPLPILAAIDLRHPERVLPGLAVDGGPRVLVTDGVGHVPVHVGGDNVV